MPQLGIRSYGVGVTTMEEVFLKVAAASEEKDVDNDVSPLRVNPLVGAGIGGRTVRSLAPVGETTAIQTMQQYAADTAGVFVSSRSE